VSYLNHKSVPSSHYFKSYGRTNSSVALWKISKFFGIKLLGGGKSSFFLSVGREGFFILFKIYSEKGFMRGNLIRLTVGDYLYDVYGICQGFSLQLLDNAVGGWEINRDKFGDTIFDEFALPQVPHLIRVTGFNFIPLEKFLPEKNSPFITLKNEFNNFYNPSPYLV
jgi:hypothetical protein